MMVADMFCGLNIDNVTDLPAQQSLLDCDIEGRIPQTWQIITFRPVSFTTLYK